MFTDTPISVEAFMEYALYDPTRGYYARQVKAVGRGGDFTTVPHCSLKLAKAIASWLVQAARETGCWNVVEIGPGMGVLLQEIRRHLPFWARLRFRFHLVERSEPLLKQQQSRLRGRVSWYATPLEALTACSGDALIYSNELVDAFPARVFQRGSNGWKEVFLKWNAEGVVKEAFHEVASLPRSTVFDLALPLGARVEVHEAFERWLAQWLAYWKKGRMLTIDYGGSGQEIYHRRQRGTLRAYLYQQRLEGADVYQHVGRQDLTTDVNFDDLVLWATPWLATTCLSDLRAWVLRWGGLEGEQDSALWSDEGAGGAFQVLEQRPS